jgi:2-polyprenyl-3-methyl-5-hydroxy-6-metoxy-1,4-benzoquinol methylase
VSVSLIPTIVCTVEGERRHLRMGYDRTFQWYGYGAKTREEFFERGYKDVARLATTIEALTGSALNSRRALDFGCGVGRLALPLAERCDHVYGLDVSPSVLREADRNARDMNLSNVEWVEAERLAELSGRYDLVLSTFVLQHIPVREGERIFAALLRGLRPGGIGAINVVLRPSHPVAGLLRWTRTLVRGWDPGYPYMLMRSYSLNRLGRLLADAGITEWHARFTPGTTWRSYDDVNIIFRKD